ncbi:MAG: lytic transglycosylase domain-containing protein [Thermoleophilaceae bacterium]|nr:lytic transglycosylase domain-containing protein [Thermoleophilaceae bacterium]
MASGPAKQARRKGTLLRGLFVAGAVIGVGVIGFVVADALEKGYREIALPLRHDDVIRQQASKKSLDPALIAAVIYRETGFRPRRSSAGALGLMQILPDTATFIAQKTGGSKFEVADLATPQINIAYGSWYLAYLLRRYDGHEVSALAAYNAGEGKVDQWVAGRGRVGGGLTDVSEIPYPETRKYVSDVLRARDEYRRQYAKELTL